MTTIPDNNGTLVLTAVSDGKQSNDLESAKFTKGNETVDVIQPTAKLIGLTKEQLEQYRNDPFWKAVRYSLFVAFWLVWLLMFAGAILIVVLSPKCVNVKWQEKMVAYKVFTLAFKDADTGSDFNAGLGDFVGIRESFGEIKEMGMNAIWPTPVLKTEKNSKRPDTVEKLEIDDEMGGEAKFTELVKSAHAKDLKVIVDVPLTVTTKGNWVKDIKDGIAKEGDDKSASTLNLNNAEVRTALVGLAKKFIDIGVDGLNLADYALDDVDQNGLAELAKQIRALKGAEEIINDSFTQANLFIRELPSADNIYQVKPLAGVQVKTVQDLVKTVHKNMDEIILLQGDKMKKMEEERKSPSSRTVWRLGSIDPQGKRLDAMIGDPKLSPENKQNISMLFSLVQLFLPAPVSVLYGEELGLLSGNAAHAQQPYAKKPNLVAYPWNTTVNSGSGFFLTPANADTANHKAQSATADKSSPLHVFSKVAKLHQNQAFILGELNHTKVDGLELYLVKQYPVADGNFYGLVVNWAGEAQNFNGTQLAAEIQVKKLTTLANTHAEMAKFEKEEATKVAVQVPGCGAVVFHTE